MSDDSRTVTIQKAQAFVAAIEDAIADIKDSDAEGKRIRLAVGSLAAEGQVTHYSDNKQEDDDE